MPRYRNREKERAARDAARKLLSGHKLTADDAFKPNKPEVVEKPAAAPLEDVDQVTQPVGGLQPSPVPATPVAASETPDPKSPGITYGGPLSPLPQGGITDTPDQVTPPTDGAEVDDPPVTPPAGETEADDSAKTEGSEEDTPPVKPSRSKPWGSGSTKSSRSKKKKKSTRTEKGGSSTSSAPPGSDD